MRLSGVLEGRYTGYKPPLALLSITIFSFHSRLQMATDDTSEYLDNTDEQVEMLLVTNFDELESGLSKILDESGPILKRNLAQVTQAVAIDNLADIVSGLGNVKRHLRDIVDQTIFVQDKVSQLKLGLSESKNRLIGSFCY